MREFIWGLYPFFPANPPVSLSAALPAYSKQVVRRDCLGLRGLDSEGIPCESPFAFCA